MADDEAAAHVEAPLNPRTLHVSVRCGAVPELQHIMYSGRVEILPGEGGVPLGLPQKPLSSISR